MDAEKYYEESFETRAVHAGQEASQWNCRAVVPPIVLATTYQQTGPDVDSAYVYSRSGNPTRHALEKCIASLEDAKYALTYASGLATQMSITYLLSAGDHIVAGDELYGGTNRFFRTCASKFGLDIDYANFQNVDEVTNSIKNNTKLIWFETPTNPLLKVSDIRAVCDAVKQKNPNIIIVVDNTFMSPYFQKPLNLGADISMNSITKYMNGHSDVIMGCISTNDEELFKKLQYYQNAVGAVPSPFDCFLVNRGLKTLAVRMEQHYKNALAIAKFLETHEKVSKVVYPGLESHPDHEIAIKQSNGFSGMIGMHIQGDIENAKEFLSHLKVFTLAESLGAVESLIEIPSLMTHASIPKETREALGIFDTFIRISVGIENVDDLIHDLDHALNKSEIVIPEGA
ncbi:hypothetical protein DERP_008038 [Dermatophagoides pteronyssinus]|uniref:Uncharacterized protein n=2 Tax=Dermatophagoides pteronyssinus TaxID=6956 RepID=A0ABQ8IWZ9_DERPT|nr:putative cystathionine gamma-lyase 2 [Dermatophagoides pteronyssinus]KAH9414839.1 hypothetical protein DERP_008680 [Dermatophagoides pteronyssinus]KAH9422775.1 hypothetical protein DERP_008038 [Dermatophagoides pteronyssinus]